VNVSDLPEIAARLTGRAGDGEEIEVIVGRSTATSVRVHDGEVESFSVAESHGVGVRLVADRREGFAHAGSFDPAIIDSLVVEARDNAAHAEIDERVGLAEPDGHEMAELDRVDPGVAALSADAKMDMALRLEERILAADPRVRGVRTSVYEDVRSERFITNSLGLSARSAATRTSLASNAMIDDTDGGTRTGAATEAARGPSGVDPDRVARLAVERGLRLLGARPPRTGRVTVVLEPRFASVLAGIVGGMLSGERVFKGRTPFADRLGQPIAASVVDLTDDPTDGEGLGAAPFDGEALATRAVPLISGGVLSAHLHDSRSARGLGATSTGSALRGVRSTPSPGHRALKLAPGSGDLESLIAGVDDGLWVQSFQGIHSGVNAVSGDLSVGVEGVRIRGGRLSEPVREATLAGAIPRLLFDVTAVGADPEWLPSGNLMPSIVVEGLTLAGTGPT
jgi:PmbA protein